MYCKDCKHWTRFSKDNLRYEESNVNRGKCSNNKFVDVSYNNWSEVQGETGKNDTLEYSDFEGYAAEFSTGENFGCIHFEKVNE